jgi:hypothetical protein
MASQTQWHQPQRIVISTFDGDYTASELKAISDDVADNYLSKGQSPVHIIFDARALGKFPVQLGAVRESAMPLLHHPSLGWIVVVGGMNPLVNFFASIVTQVTRVNYRQASSLEEAEKFLHQFDPTLA